jgi:PqqD family protein of HPr-rel-A system
MGLATEQLHWLYGNGEHVVFCQTSGQTHLLDDLGAQILITLSESGQMPFSSLLVDLEQDLDEADLSTLPAMAAERLWELDLLGLVRQV